MRAATVALLALAACVATAPLANAQGETAAGVVAGDTNVAAAAVGVGSSRPQKDGWGGQGREEKDF
eukprot:230545-Chlamydomonas_euryale.AAC.3